MIWVHVSLLILSSSKQSLTGIYAADANRQNRVCAMRNSILQCKAAPLYHFCMFKPHLRYIRFFVKSSGRRTVLILKLVKQHVHFPLHTKNIICLTFFYFIVTNSPPSVVPLPLPSNNIANCTHARLQPFFAIGVDSWSRRGRSGWS